VQAQRLTGPGRWQRPAYLPDTCYMRKPHVVARMLPYTTRRGCAVQAGAHVGVWPAALAPAFQRVLAFEPLPHLWRACVDAVKAENVLTLPCALSDATGTVTICVGAVERFGGSSMVAPGATPFPALALDDLPSVFVEDLGAILLDVEGHELAVLQGGPRLLDMWHPVVVVEENAKSLRVRKAGAVAAYLADFGYRAVDAYEQDLIFAVE
jgi:FkbM family methyltransferase